MNQIIQLGRRGFLTAAAAAGGGLSLGWSIPKAAAAGRPARNSASGLSFSRTTPRSSASRVRRWARAR